MKGAGTGWQETLMPLVQRGYQGSAQQGDGCPLQAPWCAEPRKCCAPGAKKQHAQYEVANDVPYFSQHGIPDGNSRQVHSEKKMKNRVKEARGVDAGTEVRGFG